MNERIPACPGEVVIIEALHKCFFQARGSEKSLQFLAEERSLRLRSLCKAREINEEGHLGKGC